MKVVLCALNAKYVHTNLAVRYIKAYADKHSEKFRFVISEDTVNTECSVILQKLVSHSPDAVAFSCYIWNISKVCEICNELRKTNPNIKIILGGPEVSFNPEYYLDEGISDYVQCGDGEIPMTALFEHLAEGKELPNGLGICCKTKEKTVILPPYCEKNLDVIQSPYTDEYIETVKGRIAYLETTRGCPFSCAFCLSGSDKGVRYFDDEYVENAILRLWQSGAKTIKFIDRTFNAKTSHCDRIISFILGKYEQMPKVCFHFEIAADILSESTLGLLNGAPKGLFQIEAGLQSFNHTTLTAVSRKTNTDKICENVKRLIASGNIHTHIDLIAGLPHEDLASFADSFNKAFSVGADMLQLGFLKLLYGSKLREMKDEYGYVYSDTPPYEIISTKWVSAEEMDIIRDAEDACEKVANSARFRRSLEYVLEVSGKTPFELFSGFGRRPSMPLDQYTEELFGYFSSLDGVNKDILRDRMCCDRLETNANGRLPLCLQIKDKALARFTCLLEKNPDTAPIKGVKRAVCILYSEKKLVYADYDGKKEKYKLNFVDTDSLKEE